MPENKFSFITCLAMTSLLSVSLLGCGGGEEPVGPAMNATVTGKITSGGSPVTNATIAFDKLPMGSWGTKLGEDGSFTAELTAGEYKVAIFPLAPEVKMDDSGAIPEAPKRDDIPEKFRSSATSEKTLTITEGENTFDWELK